MLKKQLQEKEKELRLLKNEKRILKQKYLHSRFPKDCRCRLTVAFDDGHNGKTRYHKLKGRIAQVFEDGICFKFDKPYRFIPSVHIAFDEFFDGSILNECDFFTMQGIAVVSRIDRIRRVVK